MRRLIAARRRGALAATLLVLLAAGPASAAAPTLMAGAASVDVVLPEGTPLGGYGGFPRRAWLPDLLGRHPYAFWFRPSEGVHDAVKARALVLDDGRGGGLVWLAIDLVGADPSLVAELRGRLVRSGVALTGLMLSASHTHSGPGAYAKSALFGFVAVDRAAPEVRGRILDALERAAREAYARRAPARVGIGVGEVTGITRSRLRAPLDPELGVLKVVAADGRPIGLLWNYAIHGTALGRDNLLVSGDLMAQASARIEQRLGVPALFVNGAVGDVSPVGRGWAGAAAIGERLAREALAVWDRVVPEPDARVVLAAGRAALPAPSLSARNCLGRWVPGWLGFGLGAALPRTAELLAVRIGGSGWVSIPGELQTRLGQQVKAVGAGRFDHVFVAGVSNDYLGYFLDAEAYAQPSYIACASLYGERGGELLRDAAVALLARLGATAEAGRR